MQRGSLEVEGEALQRVYPGIQKGDTEKSTQEVILKLSLYMNCPLLNIGITFSPFPRVSRWNFWGILGMAFKGVKRGPFGIKFDFLANFNTNARWRLFF